MATPRTLLRPPITEALVDFRAPTELSKPAFEAFAAELRAEFPKMRERREFKADLQITNGKLIPPTATDTFHGLILENEGGTLTVQLRRDGFTYNNLTSYIGGDQLLANALAIWTRFAAVAKPAWVSRVALRYINELNLPLVDGDEFRKFLTAPPELPDGAPQKVSEFLSRIVSHDVEHQVTAVVTQRLKDPRPEGPVKILVDLDVFKLAEFSPAAAQLREVLEMLRLLKNQTFFALLTDDAVRLFE